MCVSAMQRFRRLRPSLLLFAGLWIVYNSNLRPIAAGDSLPAALLPFSLALDHSVTLDRFGPWLDANVSYSNLVVKVSRGHYRSAYPIAGPLLAAPLYLPLLLVPGLKDWPPESLVALARILEKLAASIITALSAVVFLALLKRLTGERWAWRLTILYALATVTWADTSQAMWQHAPSQLALIALMLCFEIWSQNREKSGILWLAGASAACALAIRPTNAILLLALAAGLIAARASARDCARLLAPLLAAALLVLGYNIYFFNNPSGNYPAVSLEGSLAQGLAGILFSPGRGLLIYTPIALFAFCALAQASSGPRKKHAPLFVFSVVFSILHLGVIAKSVSWPGGFCWGPRLLAELGPPLIALMALGTPVLERPWPGRVFAVAAVYSILIQALGVYFYPKGRWDALPVPMDFHRERLWDWRDNPIARTLAGGPVWEPYAIVGAALTGGLDAAAAKLRAVGVRPY